VGVAGDAELPADNPNPSDDCRHATFACEVTTRAAPAAVYAELTTARGLSRWWSTRLTEEPRVGSVVQLPLGDASLRIRVERLEPDSLVLWRCVDGVTEWDGSSIRFELHPSDVTTLRLEHRGFALRPPGGALERAGFSWPRHLLRLRTLVGRGVGGATSPPRRVSVAPTRLHGRE
jgi:uncharacterized protein YndB with AHSA1/START domain